MSLDHDIKAFGIELNEDFSLKSMRALCTTPTSKTNDIQMGEVHYTIGSPMIFGESSSASVSAHAIALMLIYAKILQVDELPGSDQKILLLSGTGKGPALDLARMLQPSGHGRCKWFLKMLSLKNNIGSSEWSQVWDPLLQCTNGAEIRKSQVEAITYFFPKIQVSLKKDTFKDAQVLNNGSPDSKSPFTTNELRHSDLKLAAEKILKIFHLSHPLTWPGFKTPDHVRAAIHKPKAPAEVLLPRCLKQWKKTLLESPEWNSISILGSNPVPIEKIYVEPGCRDYDRFKSEQVKDIYANITDNAVETPSTRSVNSILLTLRNVSIFVGGPGFGKTTLTKWIAHTLISDIKKWKRIPIVVRLRDYVSSNQGCEVEPITKFFLKRFCATKQKDFSSDLQELEDLFENARIKPTFIFDGWDEVPDRLKQRYLLEVRSIEYFADVIITTRPVGLPSFLSGGYTGIYELEDLGIPSTRALVTRVCNSLKKPENINTILERLDKDKSLSRLATNPFLTTTLCEVLCEPRSSNQKIESTSALIEELLGLAIKYQRSESYHPTLRDSDIKLFSEIAFSLSFTAKEKEIEFNLHRLIKTSDAYESFTRSRIITKQRGFDQNYTFVHFSIQEYLAGRKLDSLPPDEFSEIIQRYGLSWQHVEEWKFFIGSTKKRSCNFNNFLTYWENVLDNPDFYGLIYCYAALVFADMRHSLKTSLKLVDVIRRGLIQNINKFRWNGLSIECIVQLDPVWVSEKMVQALNNNETHLQFWTHRSNISAISSKVPDSIREITGLSESMEKSKKFELHQKIQNILYAYPDNLNVMLSKMSSNMTSYREKINILKNLDYYDEKNCIDVACDMLKSANNVDIKHIWDYLINSNSTKVKIALFNKKIDIARTGSEPSEYFALDFKGGIDSQSYNVIINSLHLNPNENIIQSIALDTLNGVSLGSEGDPIAKILESTTDLSLINRASKALARSTDQSIIKRVFQVAMDTEDEDISRVILDQLFYLDADLTNIQDLLLAEIKRTDIGNFRYPYLFSFISKSRKKSNTRAYYERTILDLLKNFDEICHEGLKYWVANSIGDLHESQREKSYDRLFSYMDTPEIETFEAVTSGLAKSKSEKYLSKLCKVLDTLYFLGEEEYSTDRITFVIDAILEIQPEEIKKRFNESHLNYHKIREQLEYWAVRNLVFIHQDQAC
ncbi:MAG: NACHT domain-containing protein [Opitutales bacterium]